MRTKVIAVGNELVVVLDKADARDLGLAPGVEVEVRRDGDALVVVPAVSREERLRALAREIRRGPENEAGKLPQ